MKIFNFKNKVDDTLPRLIKYYETTAEDSNGFYINDVTIRKGKTYKFICQGSFTSTHDNSIYNLYVKFDNITPTLARNYITGNELNNWINNFSNANWFRVLRGRWGYGCLGETTIYWRFSPYVSALGRYACMGSNAEQCINTQVSSLMGPFDGTSFTSLYFSTNDTSCTINQNMKISIYELP